MKILQIAPYMTCNQVPLLSQCQSGFGYMVYDIAKSLAKRTNVDAFLYNYRYKEFDYNNIYFKGIKWINIISTIFSCSSILLLLNLFREYKVKNRTFIRLVYLWLLTGYLYKIIKNGNYNIIHIHGCQLANKLLIDVCNRLNQKYIITLHGLNSFSDTIMLEQAGKKYEKDFLKEVVAQQHDITVISSGIKNIIMNYFKIEKCDNINIINNSFSFDSFSSEKIIIREKYNLPKESKIILYIGNVSINKNQQQIIKSFEIMNDKLKYITYVLFLGRLSENVNLNEIIAKSKYENHFILCGNIEKELINSYYEQADFVVLLSKIEGFGLSLIEGMHFGLPCMCFTDFDAYNDIYSPVCMIGVNERDNQSVAAGLEQLMMKKWDSSVIKKYSEKFESDSMVNNYLNVFKRIELIK